VGWIYLCGLLIALTGAYFVLPVSVVPLLGLDGSQSQVVSLAIIALFVAAACNAAGITVLGRFNRYGMILELGVFTVITVLVVFFAPHHQDLSVLTNTLGTSDGAGDWLDDFLGGGIFVSLWVLASFENGGTLGEETIDGHRKAPKAVLGAWAVTFISGLAFILAILTAIPDLGTINTTGTPVQDVISAALNDSGGRLYLALITCITLLACTAIFAGAVRHVFSMARDGMLPGSHFLSRTSARTAAPVGAILVIGLTTALPLVASRTIAVLVTGAVAVLYVAYFLITSVLLVARVKGWPSASAPFSLGNWGLPLNAVAVLFTAAMMVNLMWPREATNPHKSGLPVAWWLLGIPLIVGIGYYLAVIAPRLRREASDESAITMPPVRSQSAGVGDSVLQRGQTALDGSDRRSDG
jgi:amino acid transporter